MDSRKNPLRLAALALWQVLGSACTPSLGLAFDVTFHSPRCAEINLPVVVIPPCGGGVFFLRTGRSFCGPFLQDGSPIEIGRINVLGSRHALLSSNTSRATRSGEPGATRRPRAIAAKILDVADILGTR